MQDPIGLFVERYHPGASVGLRSKTTDKGYTNQCTYDSDGKFISTAPKMGTVDKNDPSHFPSDVYPVEWAAKLDGMWEEDGGPAFFGSLTDNASGPYLDMYFEKRPALDCKEY